MPFLDRGQVQASHARLLATLAGLTDARARRPSRLPDWSVGHLVTHLARNADSHARMLDAAGRGNVADQYPGGNAGRAADIAAGSARPAAALVADAVASVSRLEAAWAATTEEAWRTGQGRVVSGTWPLAELPFRRWREVEVHHVDLGLGYEADDWPDAYVDIELARALAGLPARLPPTTAVDLHATDTGERWVIPASALLRRTVSAERRALLAWLLGRGDRSRFPVLGPWAG